MRLGILLTLAIAGIAGYRRLARFTTCDIVGHNATWPSSSLRICTRCPMTWPGP